MNYTTTIDTGAISTVADGAIEVRSYGMTEYARRFITGQDIVGRDSGSPSKPYAQVIWLYSAIKYLTEQIGSLPLVLSVEGKDDPLTSGKAYEFWHSMNVSTLVEQSIGWKALTGEIHWVIEGTTRRPLGIQAMLGKPSLEPQLTPDKTELRAWIWKKSATSKEILALDEIVNDIAWNPYDRWRGLSCVEAGALSLGQDYNSARHNTGLLANGAQPAGTLQTEEAMGIEQMDETLDSWNSAHRGPNKVGSVGILHSGLKWQNTTMSFRDMQFTELRKMTREEIIGGMLRIPPVLLGVQDKVSYAYLDGASELFWTNTAPPWVNDINVMLQTLTDGVQPGVRSYLDLKAAPIFAKLYGARIEQASKLSLIGYNRNNINAVLNLGMDEDEGGEETWVSNTQIPERFVLEGQVLPAEPEPEPTEDDAQPADIKEVADAATNEKLKRAIWYAWVKSWRSLENAFTQRLRKYFAQWEKAVMARLPQALKSVKEGEMRVDFTVLLGDKRKSNELLKAIVRPHVDKGVELGLLQGVTEAGATESVLLPADPVIEAFKQTKTIKVVEVNATVRKYVERGVRKAMAEAAAENETIQELANRIKKALKGSFKETRARAVTIARTETGQAVSVGRHRGGALAGSKTHGWISSKVGVRDTHVAADAAYSSPDNYIDINLPFMVGGASLMHPCDPNGPAGEIINCRCLEVRSVTRAGEAMPLVEILERGFISIEQMEIERAS